MKTNDWNSLQDLRRPLMCGLARPERGRAMRRGLTLTEILVASFVLAFGLTAVLTVLPFGAFQLNRMNVADMSGACGRGALQQIRMAEWQKPGNVWVTSNPTNYLTGQFYITADFYGTGTSVSQLCQIADPFIVDPLGLGGEVYSVQGASAQRQEFPIPVTTNNTQCLFAMTLYDATTPNGQFPANVVDGFFRWNDDTIFAGVEGSRPELVTRSSDGAPSVSGEFTWLYMVTPICNDAYVRRFAGGFNVSNLGGASVALPGNSSNLLGCTPVDNVTGYEVAAVVFHRRDLYPEPLDISTGASAAGENQYRPIRRLNLGARTINTTGAYVELQSKNAEDLDLTSIKWILLSGVSQELHDFGNGSLNAQWYRITGSDDIQGPDGSDNYTRRVFLVGPDWKGAKDPVTNNPQGTVYAILCDGVVNVFQATMPK